MLFAYRNRLASRGKKALPLALAILVAACIVALLQYLSALFDFADPELAQPATQTIRKVRLVPTPRKPQEPPAQEEPVATTEQVENPQEKPAHAERIIGSAKPRAASRSVAVPDAVAPAETPAPNVPLDLSYSGTAESGPPIGYAGEDNTSSDMLKQRYSNPIPTAIQQPPKREKQYRNNYGEFIREVSPSCRLLTGDIPGLPLNDPVERTLLFCRKVEDRRLEKRLKPMRERYKEKMAPSP